MRKAGESGSDAVTRTTSIDAAGEGVPITAFIVLKLIVLLIYGAGWLHSQTQPQPLSGALAKNGVVVEGIDKTSDGEIAGLQVGDVILGWSRGGPLNAIESPFDWADLQPARAAPGPLLLGGSRGATEKVWTLKNGVSGITTG